MACVCYCVCVLLCVCVFASHCLSRYYPRFVISNSLCCTRLESKCEECNVWQDVISIRTVPQCVLHCQMAQAKATEILIVSVVVQIVVDSCPVSRPLLLRLLRLLLYWSKVQSGATLERACLCLSVSLCVSACVWVCVCAKQKISTRRKRQTASVGAREGAAEGGWARRLGDSRWRNLVLLANDADIRRRVLCVCT